MISFSFHLLCMMAPQSITRPDFTGCNAKKKNLRCKTFTIVSLVLGSTVRRVLFAIFRTSLASFELSHF